MKISELLEAQDYNRIKDPSLKWLGQYTYEGQNKWPGAHIIQDLLERFPCDAGMIYRGMNFYTKDEYDKFIQQFGGDDQAELEFGSITSWSADVKTASQFALTQPTYFVNMAVVVAHGEMQKNRERLSGYRGIILSMQINKGEGIDVAKSDVGHESEVILPPGTHQIQIHQVIKRYADQISDKEVDINQAVMRMKASDLKSDRSDHHTLFDYVVQHHVHELSDAARNHIFKLVKPKSEVQLFMHEAQPSMRFGEVKSDKVHFHYWVPAWQLFELYDQGVFTNPTHITYVKNLAKRIIKQALPVFEKYVIPAEWLDMRLIKHVAQVADQLPQFTNMLKRTVGAEYHRLQDEGRLINQISDHKQREKSLEDHVEKLRELMKKMA